jgi:hypothetical protein
MNYLEVDMTYAEMFLMSWAVVMTVMYYLAKRNAEVFKQFTVFKLKQVASGEATIVVNDEYVQIISKEIV